LTDQNPLIGFMREHRDEVYEALRYKADRGIILSSLLLATYEFVYDMLFYYGKFFHVQDQVPTSLIAEKLSEKYCSNRSLPNAMNSAIPMLLEAGILQRPSLGIYEHCRVAPTTEVARKIYDQAFLHWNPNYNEEDIPRFHPYYEFIN
jgi:hypothetical protein